MDYYEILQLEFLSYYFRYKTYSGEQYIQKYFEFCKKKKKSIEGLSRRNCSLNIFDDKKYFNKKLDKFLSEAGMPSYTYRDEHQKTHIGFWDKVHFFSKGTEVLYIKSDEIWVVNRNLCKFDEDNDFVILEQKGKPTIKVGYSEIKRVFDIEEFDFDIF